MKNTFTYKFEDDKLKIKLVFAKSILEKFDGNFIIKKGERHYKCFNVDSLNSISDKYWEYRKYSDKNLFSSIIHNYKLLTPSSDIKKNRFIINTHCVGTYKGYCYYNIDIDINECSLTEIENYISNIKNLLQGLSYELNEK